MSIKHPIHYGYSSKAPYVRYMPVAIPGHANIPMTYSEGPSQGEIERNNLRWT